MMDNNKIDEENIAKLLSKTPDIKDSRSKEQIMRRLQEDDRIKTQQNKKSTNKKMKRWIPILVTVAALVILAILLPSMLNGGNNMDQATERNLVTTDKDEESSGSEIESTSEDSKVVEDENEELETPENDVQDSLLAVYPDDVGKDTLFHIGLVGETAASVPVSFLIPERQIIEDFGEVKPTSFDLYEMYASKIDEKALGFDDYHSYKGTLAVEGNNLIQTLPEGHGYDIGSASLEVHSGTLQDTFYGFDEIQFRNEDGTPVVFDQVGEASKPMQLMSGVNFYNYYLSKHTNGNEYLSPNFLETHDTLTEALYEMKNKPNDIFSPVIPMDVSFEVKEEKEFTTIKFKEELDLFAMDEQEVSRMINAILLTGSSFGMQLKIDNIKQSDWNNFNFEEPLPIPVGSNLLPFLLKE